MEEKGHTGLRRLKGWVSVLLLIVITGVVSGCASQPTEEENRMNAEKMLEFVSEKYDLEFQIIEYIPGEKGFNDFMEENVLIAESEEGVLVNVKEKLGDIGNYYDDYTNFYASKMVDEKMDFSKVDHLVAAKSYAPVLPDNTSYEELKKQDIPSADDVIRFYNYVAIREAASEEILEQLYDVYQQIESMGFESNVLVVTFSGDEEKAKKMVNNFFFYGTKAQDWESFDPSIKEVLRVGEMGLTYKEFKDHLTKVEG